MTRAKIFDLKLLWTLPSQMSQQAPCWVSSTSSISPSTIVRGLSAGTQRCWTTFKSTCLPLRTLAWWGAEGWQRMLRRPRRSPTSCPPGPGSGLWMTCGWLAWQICLLPSSLQSTFWPPMLGELQGLRMGWSMTPASWIDIKPSIPTNQQISLSANKQTNNPLTQQTKRPNHPPNLTTQQSNS